LKHRDKEHNRQKRERWRKLGSDGRMDGGMWKEGEKIKE
jgi:hypothetical protein